jgi:hypothetical protein
VPGSNILLWQFAPLGRAQRHVKVRAGGGVMNDKNAAWYRAQAEACLARAEKATDPRISEFNRAEAERWLRLAELAEKQKPEDKKPDH